MKIKCDKDILLQNINIVQKAVSSRTTMPILECILLVCDQSGFSLTATDLELGIKTAPIEAEILEMGSIALGSRIFSDIIRKLPDGEVSIEVNDSLVTVIKCQNAEFRIVGQIGEEFPALPEVEKNNAYQITQLNLRNMIKQSIFSIALDESKPALTGELIEIKSQHILFVAVDGYRVSYKKDTLLEGNGEEKVIVPGKTLSELSKILLNDDEQAKIFFTEKHILFDLGNCVVLSRLLDGEFLNYEQIFTEDYATRIKVNKDILQSSIERVSLISYQENKKTPVKLEISADEMRISSNTEIGAATDKIPVQSQGDKLEIAFNPKYILDALKAITDEEIYIEFNTPLSPCTVKPVDHDHYKYLILPLRLK